MYSAKPKKKNPRLASGRKRVRQDIKINAANTGTNAWLNAPSANKRRNKLGIRNATLKASVRALAPNVEAISNSRIKPVMRETRVKPETMDADLNSEAGREEFIAELPPPLRTVRAPFNA